MENIAAAKARGRAGWSEYERKLLQQEIQRVRENGLPLKSAFENLAIKTGRKPNSIRNYYYAHVKQGSLGSAYEKGAFTPFTQQEIEDLIEKVLTAQAQGMSVRGITMRLGNGDKKAMLRYQNKYRSMVKNNPETVLEIIKKMRAEGKTVFDPYSQQRPHKSGRKPNSKRRMDMDTALAELGASLKRLKGVDAGVFVQQLATLASMAVGDG